MLCCAHGVLLGTPLGWPAGEVCAMVGFVLGACGCDVLAVAFFPLALAAGPRCLPGLPATWPPPYSSFLHGVFRALNGGRSEETNATIPMADLRDELSSVLLCYGRCCAGEGLPTPPTHTPTSHPFCLHADNQLRCCGGWSASPSR